MGGDRTLNPSNAASECPTGLQTLFAGAKSQAQCFTLAGYGRVSSRGTDGKTLLSAVVCEVGTYNVGGNSAGCQRCGPGLTTAGNGSTSISQCGKILADVLASVKVDFPSSAIAMN
jgi:hypothetical protein